MWNCFLSPYVGYVFWYPCCTAGSAAEPLLQASTISLLSLAIDFPPARKDSPEQIWTALTIDCQHPVGAWRTLYHHSTLCSEANRLGSSFFSYSSGLDLLFFWSLLIFNELESFTDFFFFFCQLMQQISRYIYLKHFRSAVVKSKETHLLL